MTSLVTVTLGTFVDRTLEELQGPTEVARICTRVATLTSSATSITLATGSASVSDVIEFGAELMLVTVAAAPVYTVARGYYNTVAVAHGANETGYVNPLWPRHRAAGAVRRAFVRLSALGVPLVKSTTLFPEVTFESDNYFYVDIPDEAIKVLKVRDDLAEIDHWELVEDLPTSTTGYFTGKVVRLPRWVTVDDDFNVVYEAAYRWDSYPTDPDETAEIDVPEAAEFLPAAYAAAWLCSAREVSRYEIDRSTEWAQSEPSRGGVSQSLVRSKWQEFYRALDEVKRVNPPIPARTYVRRSRRGWSRWWV